MGVHLFWGELPEFLMRINKIILMAMLIGCMTTALNAVSLVTVPNPQVATVSQAFQIQVSLNSASSIRGYSIYFGFNQSLIQFVSASQGSLFSGTPVGWWNVTNVSPGVVRVECIIFGPGLFVTGPGIILNANFTGLAEGYSAFTFNQVELYDVTGAIIPNVTTTNGNILIGTNLAYLGAKCYLQGPFGSGLMNTGINEKIPLTSPYPSDPITVASIPSNVVDWILMELRQTSNGTTYRSQSLFLLSDGTMITPGKPFVVYNGTPAGSYFIVIRHRNHLSIMSSSAAQVAGSGTMPYYDFTLLSSVYGSGSTVTLENGLQGLAVGDSNQDGSVGLSDRNDYWRLQAGRSGYLSADYNLDGNVFPNDLNGFWRINFGMTTDVP
jgi:hypothetical protein